VLPHRCIVQKKDALSIYHLVYIQILCGEQLCMFFTWRHSSAPCIMFDIVCYMHSTLTWFIQFCVGICFVVVLDVWHCVLDWIKSNYDKLVTYIENYVACHN
jgi:E3 ubiquitin-protein ligase DOA10